VKNRKIHDRVSFDVNPTSRRILENLIRDGHLLSQVRAGARIDQEGCNGCIGMGQATATNKLSLRTVPRISQDGRTPRKTRSALSCLVRTRQPYPKSGHIRCIEWDRLVATFAGFGRERGTQTRTARTLLKAADIFAEVAKTCPQVVVGFRLFGLH